MSTKNDSSRWLDIIERKLYDAVYPALSILVQLHDYLIHRSLPLRHCHCCPIHLHATPPPIQTCVVAAREMGGHYSPQYREAEQVEV